MVGVAFVAWRRIRGRVGIHWRLGRRDLDVKRARVALNIVMMIPLAYLLFIVCIDQHFFIDSIASACCYTSF